MTGSLPSWAPGRARDAVLGFVQESAREGSAGFVPEPERVAAFDNDGTLWVEQPAPVQAPFLVEKLAARVRADPSLAARQPYTAIAAQDADWLAGLALQVPEVVAAFLQGVGEVWEGTTPQEFEAEVTAWLASHRHERFGVPFTDLVYRPMLELFDLLTGHGWRVFVCSGGGRDFMRVIAEDTWGIRRENVIGTAPEYVWVDGQLRREAALRGRVALGPGKPEQIYARTGRMARFACGNGDVDLEMLQAATFPLVIVHDDAEREYATTAGAQVLLAAADTAGWTTVSMREDWTTIF